MVKRGPSENLNVCQSSHASIKVPESGPTIIVSGSTAVVAIPEAHHAV